MGTSDRFDGLGDGFTLGVGGFDEDIGEGNTSFRIHGEVLGADLREEGNRVFLEELVELTRGEYTSEIVSALVEGLVEHDSRSSDSRVGGRVGGDTEEVVVTVDVGVLGERSLGGRIGFVEVGDQNELVGTFEGGVVGFGDGRYSG